MAKVRIDLDTCQWTGAKLRKLIVSDKDKAFADLERLIKNHLGSEDFVVVDGVEIDGTYFRF